LEDDAKDAKEAIQLGVITKIKPANRQFAQGSNSHEECKRLWEKGSPWTSREGPHEPCSYLHQNYVIFAIFLCLFWLLLIMIFRILFDFLLFCRSAPPCHTLAQHYHLHQ